MKVTLPPTKAVLTEEKLAEYFQKLKKPETCASTKTRLRNRIFLAFMRYAHKVTLQFNPEENGLEVGDAASTAYLALFDAIDSFEPSRGVRFTTYAAKVIQRALRASRRRVLNYRKRVSSLESYLEEAPTRSAEDGERAGPPLPERLISDPWDRIHDSQTYQDALEVILSRVRLTVQQKAMILDYMECNGNLAEVGRRWGKTRARVQQVWAEVCKTIRQKYEETVGFKLDTLIES